VAAFPDSSRSRYTLTSGWLRPKADVQISEFSGY
jgi:hypothetical protein